MGAVRSHAGLEALLERLSQEPATSQLRVAGLKALFEARVAIRAGLVRMGSVCFVLFYCMGPGLFLGDPPELGEHHFGAPKKPPPEKLHGKFLESLGPWRPRFPDFSCQFKHHRFRGSSTRSRFCREFVGPTKGSQGSTHGETLVPALSMAWCSSQMALVVFFCGSTQQASQEGVSICHLSA